jgi:hypothetical protein
MGLGLLHSGNKSRAAFCSVATVLPQLSLAQLTCVCPCAGCCLLHLVHWVFGRKTQNTSVALNNATLELLHEAPQSGGCH